MKNNNLIKSIILAAGEGKRLRPYTLDRPKCLVEVEGLSLLERQLRILKKEGVNNITIVGGYRSDMIQGLGFDLMVNPLYNKTNMLSTLLCAEELLDGETLLSYGDIVYSKNILRKVIMSDCNISVAIDLNWESYWRARNGDPLIDAESLKLGENDRIVELGQRPSGLSEIEGQYMGLIKLSSVGAQTLRTYLKESFISGDVRGKNFENAYMTDLLQKMIDNNVRIDAVPIRDDWVEIDTVEDLNNPITRERLSSILNC